MMTGQFLFRRAFNQARQFFADDRTQRRGNETEIHHAERDAVFANLADAGQDGVFQVGRRLMFLNALGVGSLINKFEQIHAGHVGVHLLERAGLDQRMNAFARADGKMIFALRADLQVFVQFLVENHRFALRAFGPKPFRDVALFGFARRRAWAFWQSWSARLWPAAGSRPARSFPNRAIFS